MLAPFFDIFIVQNNFEEDFTSISHSLSNFIRQQKGDAASAHMVFYRSFADDLTPSTPYYREPRSSLIRRMRAAVG